MMRSALVILLFTFAFAASGCLGGPIPQDHFYRLELPTTEPRFPSPPLLGTLQITRPVSDALTSERHLLYRQNSHTSHVRRHGYHRWVDSPTLIIQQQIARYLRHSRFAQQVVTPEHRVKADYRFSCRIAKLERILSDPPRVVMELELGLTHVRHGEAIWLQTYHIEHPADGTDISASVVAYNHALTKILDAFLSDTSTLPEPIPVNHRH